MKIREWEERVQETDATTEDIADPEKVIKMLIILKYIAGEVIYNSRKYLSHGVDIDIIFHNWHVLSKYLHDPQSKEVSLINESYDVWKEIRQISNELVTVWLLGGQQDKQLNVDQFVLPHGPSYRAQYTHRKIQEWCALLITDREFGTNEAAIIIPKQGNDWKITLANLQDDIQEACMEHGHGGLWNSVNYDMRDILSVNIKHAIRQDSKDRQRLSSIPIDSGIQLTVRPELRLLAHSLKALAPALPIVQEWELEKIINSVNLTWLW